MLDGSNSNIRWFAAISTLFFAGIFLIVLILLILLTYFVNTPLLPVVTILTVAIGGVLGGLGFEITDDQLNLPEVDTRTKNAFTPGCLGSMLYGLIGGFVIFLVVPGDFDLKASALESVKLFALSALGGYGGRVLIERALEKQYAELQKQVKEIQDQPTFDAKALSLVDQHLDDDPDTEVKIDELQGNILKASKSVLVWTFEKARNFRRDSLHNGEFDKIPLVIPIFEALIKVDQRENEPEKYHRNFGQLGYALKDQPKPENERAIEVLTKAIEVRDREERKKTYLWYEFNRAICNIRLDQDFAAIKSDLDLALREPKIAKIIKLEGRKKDEELLKWYKKNQGDLKEWLTENGIDLQEDDGS